MNNHRPSATRTPSTAAHVRLDGGETLTVRGQNISTTRARNLAGLCAQAQNLASVAREALAFFKEAPITELECVERALGRNAPFSELVEALRRTAIYEQGLLAEQEQSMAQRRRDAGL